MQKLEYILAHPELYPEDLIEKAKRWPETIDVIYDYPRDKDISVPFVKDWETGCYPLLLQWDKRWAYKPYCGSSVASAGCGPTSLAIIYNGLMGEALKDPYELCVMASELGYAYDGEGTHEDFFFEGGRRLGLRCYVPERSEEGWRAALKAGHPLIINVGPGDFTSGGHFIVSTEWHEEGFKILDPNSLAQSAKPWTFAQLDPQTKGAWAFARQNPEE